MKSIKNYYFAICLVISGATFGQIRFDSCFVYKGVEAKDVKETDLLYEFFQLSGSKYGTDKLSNADMQTLNTAVNRATNMTFALPKLPASAFFMRCHTKEVLYGFAVIADKHLMIDAVRNVKLVFENKEDIEFLNRLEKTYSK